MLDRGAILDEDVSDGDPGLVVAEPICDAGPALPLRLVFPAPSDALDTPSVLVKDGVLVVLDWKKTG